MKSDHKNPYLNPETLAFARKLRGELTDPEKHLWRLLRNRRLEGYKFRRQYPVEPYILDFFCVEARLAVELDGGQHGESEGEARDAQRSAFLASKGIRVLRFWNNHVFKNTEGVLATIYEALKNPHPHPLPEGEGAGEHLF